MAQKLLFLTGRLAEARLAETVAALGLPDGSWAINNLGIKVAALMTESIVKNRLKAPLGADRVIVPGRSRMDLGRLAGHYGVPFERGPDELIDLPEHFGKGGKPPDLTRHDLRIFAEIIEAPTLAVEEIVRRGAALVGAGADVVDIGCQPDTAFPHLETAVGALKAAGLRVSVDSGDTSELRRGAEAGADYVLSLDETTLDVVSGTRCVPILVPKPHGDLASLLRAIDKATALRIPHIADPILDPIHFGFTASLERYAELRRQRPGVEILMGTGNLTELTEVDSQGLTATLVGICSELRIGSVLVVQVSPHTRRTVEEHDAARRLMFRAREDKSLPKGYGGGLLSLHDVRPNPYSGDEVRRQAEGVRDANFRIEVTAEGVHIYNRDGHHVATDPYQLFDKLGVASDGPHAFYLGYELAKAELAWRLGKRYAQDNPLDWGIAAERPSQDLTRHAPEQATLKAKKEARSERREKAAAGAAENMEERDAADRRDDRDDA
jgi:dihydropteroate synthase